jgi:Fur family ferric uptake transcriptional regulator
VTIPEAHVYRSTPQRDAILHVVREARDHPTARDVWERVQRHRPGIGVATVYRTLDLLAANGMVLALQLGDDAIARYDGNVAAHDHVVCEVCGVIADVTVPLPDGTVQAVEEDTGFAIRGSELQFRGVCPGCR